MRSDMNTCPYCFTGITRNEVQFRCVNIDPVKCPPVEDKELTGYLLRDKDDPNQVVSDSRCFGLTEAQLAVRPFGLPALGYCPHCGEPSEKIVCPHCHNDLPRSIFDGRSIVISVVGTRDSGKSVFVGVLIHELETRIAEAFNGNSAPFNEEETRVRYHNRYGMLYNGTVPPRTQGAISSNHDSNAYAPLIYTLSLKTGGVSTDYSIVIYDIAGEDLEETDKIRYLGRETFNCDGIIYILDITKIDSVRGKLDSDILDGASRTEGDVEQSEEIINRLAGFFETHNREIPAAVVISKLDVLKELADNDAQFSDLADDLSSAFSDSPHCPSEDRVRRGEYGTFDAADAANVNGEVDKFLFNYKGFQNFRNKLSRKHKKHYYFTVSALGFGNNPSGTSINTPTPHRIEDPFLWILKEKGVVPATDKPAQTIVRNSVNTVSQYSSKLIRFAVKHKVTVCIAALILAALIALTLFLSQPRINPKSGEQIVRIPVMDRNVTLIVPLSPPRNEYSLNDVSAHPAGRNMAVGNIGELKPSGRVGDGRTLRGKETIYADISIAWKSLAVSHRVTATLEQEVNGSWEFVKVVTKNIRFRLNNGSSVPYELFTHDFSRRNYRVFLYVDGYLVREDYQMRGEEEG